MVEGSAAQYRFEQPFDRQALLTAMGGPSVVNPILSNYFTQLNDCDFNAPYACFANEMDLGQEYWPTTTSGQPWVAQSGRRQHSSQPEVFQDQPELINNNDDLGAESSVLVWSMLGLYPDLPGSAVMTLNSPEFPQELIHLPSSATITVNAPGASATSCCSVAPGELPSVEQGMARLVVHPEGRRSQLWAGRNPEHDLGDGCCR